MQIISAFTPDILNAILTLRGYIKISLVQNLDMQHDFVYEKFVKYLKRWADNFFRLVINWTIFHFFYLFLTEFKSFQKFCWSVKQIL